MNTRWKILIPMVGSLLFGLLGKMAIAQDLPVVKGRKIVASVNGEPITLEEFRLEVGSVAGDKPPGERAGKQDESVVLQRMIATRLIAQEAKQIGLDTLPEMRKMIDSFSRVALREELADKVTREVKPDEQEVEKIYTDAIREWRISAVLCDREEDAKSLEAAVKAGKDFQETAQGFLREGKAKSVEDGVYIKPSAMEPQLRQAASTMAVGSTSSVIRTKNGFIVLRLEDMRTAEDPEAKARATQIVLTNTRQEALRDYDKALKKKYVKIHDEVLKRIDYESPSPGIEALLKDTRVVAEIKGEKPVTVGEMTEELRFQVFHGVEGAAERKRLNAKKEVILEGLLHRKVFRKEALRLGLDKTESYKSKLKEHETGVLFGAFLRKVIDPEITLKEDEIRAHYAAHQAEYSAPEMMRIRGLVFGKREAAQDAMEKLKAGAELQWLASHAEGELDSATKGVLSFDGKPLITNDLPEGVGKAVAGARAGDSRLYASPEGHFYVLAIQEVIPSKPRPYGQARQDIAEKLVEEKRRKAVEEYADKLRSVSEIKIYLKG